MRLRECIRNFGRSICGSTHFRSCDSGFKKPAAYQTFGRKHRVKEDVKKWPCPVMGGIFQDAIYMHDGCPLNVVPYKYVTRVVITMVSGVTSLIKRRLG